MNKKEIESIKSLIKSHNVEIDYEKLSDAIAKAQVKADEDKEKKEHEKNREAIEKWQNTIGLKEEKTFSYVKAFFRMLCLKKKDIDGDRITTTLLMFIAKGIMQFVMLCMFLLMVVSIVGIFVIGSYTNGNITLARIELLMVSFMCFTFGNLFRISSYEIEKMENKDYLNTILTSILAILGTVIAIISLVKGK